MNSEKQSRNKVNLWSKIIQFFKTKQELLKIIRSLECIANNKLEELEQNKCYILAIEDITPKEMDHIRNNVLPILENKIKWTLPEIFIINRRIELISDKNRKRLANKILKGGKK